MRHLFLYSDQEIEANQAMDLHLLAAIAARGSDRRIAYVASGPEPDRAFFTAKRDYYRRYDLDLALFFDCDRDGTPAALDALFACPAIHLTGGHTGQFLDRLRKAGLMEPLRNWALAGGILIGTSAGAILMTPDIALDRVFLGERAEDMKDGAGLDLVDFEFFPHWEDEPQFAPDVLRYSLQNGRDIIACRDGEGVVIKGDTVTFFGAPDVICKGTRTPAI